MTDNEEQGKLRITGEIPRLDEGDDSPPPVASLDDVTIVVTQLFCPKGHNLVYDEKFDFEGYKGISIAASDGEVSGIVVLSPFHGDHRKKGKTDFAVGTQLELSCPICGAPFEPIGKCSCAEGSTIVAMYLSKKLSEGDVVGICTTWGCYKSRVIDNFEIISEFLESEADE
jgi:hypothetical protein